MPYVIEPAAGLTRAVLAFLLEAYDEDEAPNTKGGVDKRTVHAVRPAARAGQGGRAAAVAQRRTCRRRPATWPTQLRKRWIVEFDDAQAIGRRYRRQDEIGTPFCVTVDFDTLDDDAVTVRDRDTMTQERVVAGPGRALPDRAPARLLSASERAKPPGPAVAVGDEAGQGRHARSRPASASRC